MQVEVALTAETEVPGADLGPLAWVLDELRKSLEGATRALRRFVRDAELARGSNLADLDASQLRIARQQLHQAVGALEMVGMTAPAKVLRAMETLAQYFVQHPEACSEAAAQKMERASFALNEYLEGVLKGRSSSCVALFPQYRDILALTGDERTHPADLWMLEWRWTDAYPVDAAPATEQDVPLRARFDAHVLKVVQSADRASAQMLCELALGFAASQSQLEPRAFWQIGAAYFEAMAQGLCAPDVYAKRAASRILLQYRSLSRGEISISERLVHDLLFFCAQAVPDDTTHAPVLKAVRAAYSLVQAKPVDYEHAQFGRFDPALLVLARKRIAAATETWSALAGGDTNRLKMAVDQFHLVTDTVLKLHPESADLVQALTRAVEVTARSGEAPAAPLAIEVATTVLFLEAAYEDLDPTDSHMGERCASLARRLEHVIAGGQPEALESWMEDLYRRVSDRQIMGSVVDELRTTLGGVEKSLDAFFRHPQDKVPLHEVPSQLGQMRGVFSVLGLDQAALAALRMRSSVEKFLSEDLNYEAAGKGLFEKLGNSLGALGFLIDMLSYQRALAKKLFVYDEDLAEFKPLMGREKSTAPLSRPAADVSPALSVPPVAKPPSVPGPVPSVEPQDDDERELRSIFLDEAREVVQAGLTAIRELAQEPGDLSQQTTLRRSLHTLKGSARMVGLAEFGEAAWAMEQLLNAWLAEQKPASDDLVTLSGKAVQGFGHWIEDIARSDDSHWSAGPFRKSADSLRLHGTYLDLLLDVQDASAAQAEPLAAAPALPTAPGEEEASPSGFHATQLRDFDATELTDFSATVLADPTASEEAERSAQDVPSSLLADLDFTGLDTATPVAAGAPTPAVVESTQAESAEQAPPLVLEFPPEESAAPAPAVELSTLGTQDHADEQIKVIGDLRIDIPLYNVYLNEADEWSRRLQTELGEWALELHRPMADSPVALSHSLAGSSATVGFSALSRIARALEHALLWLQIHGHGTPEQARLFCSAAEDIRRLLHQFAAGFLKEPDAAVVEALQALLASSDSGQDQAVVDLEESLASQIPPQWADEDADTVLPAEALQDAGLQPAPADFPAGAEAAPGVPPADAESPESEAQDRLDVDLFPIFEEEAAELLPQLGGALRQWTARPENLGARGEALRVLHTLKGSARLAGALHLGDLAHRMESAIEEMGAQDLQAERLLPLLGRFDTLQDTFQALRATPKRDLVLPEAPAAEPELSEIQPSTQAGATAPVAAVLAMPAFAPLAPVQHALSGQSVRVRSQLLDQLVNQAGEVLITRARLESRLGQLRGSLDELTGNLERLRSQLRDVELQSESQMQSRLAAAKDSAAGFDPLEFDRFTRVQELTRMMAESVHDVATVQRSLQRTVEGVEDDLIAQARQAREVQRDLLRTRMVEFDSISERLHGVVRQSAKESDRQVQLEIRGGSLDMDRGVLERMTPAFEHLLRNAVVHGVEPSSVRALAGKPALGTIVIELHQQGNDVTVLFHDDGAGLDLQLIREKALARGLITVGQDLNESQVAALIFNAGLSTATQVTELAGRGIGLDVVRSQVNALGGRIEISTQRGLGTKFKLVLPLTTAVTQVVMLRVGGLMVGVPANLVEMVRRVSGKDLDRAYEDHLIEFDGEQVAFFWAGSLLQASAHSSETRSKTLPIAIFRSAGQRVAMHVDEVLGNQEVVVKNLGPQLSRLPALTGMSVLASGAVVLIYNPVALAAVYGVQARLLENSQPTGHDRAPVVVSSGQEVSVATPVVVTLAPLVLVVDDSITVRRVTQRLLKREGFRVALANDGLQALERLQEEIPSVVLSDIEMPRMDGFDLARNIRADARLAHLPIIMITSRIAEKHHEHARELGVNHYLGKPYSEDILIGLVRQYCETHAEQEIPV